MTKHTMTKHIIPLLLSALAICAIHADARAQLKVGEAAPDFQLKDQTGAAHTLKQHRGKIVVLEWVNPTCPFVVKHYERKTMQGLRAKSPEVVWIPINSSYYMTDKDNAEWAKSVGVPYVLNDVTGEVGKRYGARTTPHMYVIDPEGKLAYQGAIDDNAHFDDRPTKNYVALAISALKAKRAPETPEVRPYGCSVKYKR